MLDTDRDALMSRRAQEALEAQVLPDGWTLQVRGDWRRIGVSSLQLPVQAINGDEWKDGNLLVQFPPGSAQVVRAALLVQKGEFGRNPYRCEGHNAPFSPSVTNQDGGDVYWDGSVHASVSVGPGAIGIYEFSSNFPSQGRAERALRWMKQTYGWVSAHSVGSVFEEDGVRSGDISLLFWDHMRSKGLVDLLELDSGLELPVDWETNENFDEDLQSFAPRPAPAL